MTDYLVPLIFLFILLYGKIKKVDLFDAFTEGAREGLSAGVRILPSLIILMTCVSMLKASGGLDFAGYLLRPIASILHLPAEAVPLAVLRPLSGSGALVFFEELLRENGADSLVGRVASVMMGSTETTFYTIAVYYGAVKIKRTRHTVAAALVGDFTGFVMSALTVNLFFAFS